MPNKETLLAQAKSKDIDVPEGATKAEIQALIDKSEESEVSFAEKNETRRDEAKAVDTKLGTSEEEAAADRAGVDGVVLDNPKQNREPKNEFEQSNQKVTEEERQVAQKVSDMTTENRVKDSPTPAQGARTDASRSAEVNQGSEIAQAIAQGLQSATEGNKKKIKITSDNSVDSRFTVVKSKTGEVMLRENETGVLSKVQLESLEEKEASIQGQEVKEI